MSTHPNITSEKLTSLPQLGRIFGLAESTTRRRLERKGITPDFTLDTGNGRNPLLAFRSTRIAEIGRQIAA